MKFGAVPLVDAEGALLAHSRQLPSGKLSKGTVLTAAMLREMADAGDTEVIVARLAPDDVDENAAAAAVAAALVPDPSAAGLMVSAAFTGRVNLVAAEPGIVELDEEAIHRLNGIDPMLTLATVPQYARVTSGMMVGTVKIIAYAVPGQAVKSAQQTARGAIAVRPAELRTASLVLTELSEADARLRDNSVAAIAGRLEMLGMTLSDTRVTAHRSEAVAAELARIDADMVMILTASATSDIDDVGPAAVRAAGGRVDRF